VLRAAVGLMITQGQTSWVPKATWLGPALLCVVGILWSLALREWPPFQMWAWGRFFPAIIPRPDGTRSRSTAPVESAVQPHPRVRNIDGAFWNVSIKSVGTIIESGQRWIRCGLKMDVSLVVSGDTPVRIERIYMATYRNRPPCRSLPISGDLAVSEILNSTFAIRQDIEFHDDASGTLPGSLELIVVDVLGAKHAIHLRDRDQFPPLANLPPPGASASR
jgi:hypothetical protein